MYFLEDLDEEEYEIAIKVSKDFYYYLHTSMYMHSMLYGHRYAKFN